jgi:hypothetical protein
MMRNRQIELRPASLKVIVPENQTNDVDEAIVAIDWEQIDFASQPIHFKSKVILPQGVRRQPKEPEAIEVNNHWETEAATSEMHKSPRSSAG